LPGRCLMDVFAAERSACEQVEDVAVDAGSHGFHEIEREGVAASLVGMEDPETRVETNGVLSPVRSAIALSVTFRRVAPSVL
jgi:hypothetical protein